MTYIPQAVVNERAQMVLAYIPFETEYLRHWKGVLPTVDAPGIPIHPRDVGVDDVIDTNPIGWSKTRVVGVKFVPHDADIPEYHRWGYYQFTTDDGYRNSAVDGRTVEGPKLYIFP